MYIVGYAYNSNPSTPGFRPEPNPFYTAKEAIAHIKEKLAGQQVTFEERDGKSRAYADGEPTNWLYFEVAAETWALVDLEILGTPRKQAVMATGPIHVVKEKARAVLTKELNKRGNTLKGVDFRRTRDNIAVSYTTTTDTNSYDPGLALIRVS